jgi:hypothetical protein
MVTSFSFHAFPEMNAGPIPVGLAQRESHRVLPSAEDPTDQTFTVFDAPKTVTTSGNIELMRLRASPLGEVCRRAFH